MVMYITVNSCNVSECFSYYIHVFESVIYSLRVYIVAAGSLFHVLCVQIHIMVLPYLELGLLYIPVASS